MIGALSQFPEGQIIAFALVLMRMIAFIVAMPIFGSNSISVQLKILISIVLSLAIFSTLKFSEPDLIKISDELVLLTIREIFVGLFLGFLMRLFFFAVSIAGELIGISSGLASAQIFNPAMGTQGSVLEHFYSLVATLFFLGVNGHHLFLIGVAQSYEIIPVASIAIKTQGFLSLTAGFQKIILIGIQLSAPVLISIFMTNLAMGVLGRAVPQMNVLVTSLQVTFLITIVIVMITIPFFVDQMQFLIRDMGEHVFAAMRVI